MAIHPDAQKLLDKLNNKGRLTGYETGRLLMFNAIDVYSGAMEILDRHRIGEAVGKLRGEQSANYQKYAEVFDVLSDARNRANDVAMRGQLACQSAMMFCDNVLFANRDYPKCHWRKYGLDSIDECTRLYGANVWTMARDAIQFCEKEWIRFELVGLAIKTPGLEKMLETRALFDEVRRFNKFAESARAELKPKVFETYARLNMWDATTPLIIPRFVVPEYARHDAKDNIRLDNFKETFEKADDILLLGFEQGEPET